MADMSRGDYVNSEEWVLTQHKHAKSIYEADGAKDFALEVEGLFKADYGIPQDTADTKNSGPKINHPARGRAILEKYLSLLMTRANMGIQVMPHKSGLKERDDTTRLEQWIEGYINQFMRETKTNFLRHFVYWYLLRGRAVIELHYDQSYDEYGLPFRIKIPDPLNIYTVWGDSGIAWYTKEYEMYAWEAKHQIDSRGGTIPRDWPKDENKKVHFIEYWDSEHNVVLVNKELVWDNDHGYGFVPIVEAYCSDTPLSSARWAYQSVLGPIMDSLKNIYALMAKMATGVDLFYWPKILVQSPTGEAVMLDSGVVGVEKEIPTGSKIDVISPTPNAQVINILRGELQSDINLGGIPELAFGEAPTSLESGFALSQVLGTIMDRISDKKINLELALGWLFGMLLQMAEMFAGSEGVNLDVPVDADMEEKGRPRKTMRGIKASDVKGRHSVIVNISPELPQDRTVKAQLAAAYREPGSDGKPLMADVDILEHVLEVPHPELSQRHIREQLLPTQSKTIDEIIIKASEQQWMDENEKMVKLAEKRVEAEAAGEGLPLLTPEQVTNLMQVASVMQQAGGPEALQMLLQQAETGATPAEMAQGSPTSGFSAEAQPPQITMSPDDVLPDPEQVKMRQQQRAGNPPR
jgi:hypothetical protein